MTGGSILSKADKPAPKSNTQSRYVYQVCQLYNYNSEPGILRRSFLHHLQVRLHLLYSAATTPSK